MSDVSETARPRYLENLLLLTLGLVAQAPLWYQLPRWADGLDPTFVAPATLARSSLPLLLYLVKVPPVVWLVVMILAFMRICQNYGWRLEK